MINDFAQPPDCDPDPESNAQLCPQCMAPEVPAFHPRTVYDCGSSDYDQRPGTFKQSEECRERELAT